MAIRDIKIEPTDDIDLLRLRVQDTLNNVIKEINTSKVVGVKSFGNQRITDLGDPAQPKDAVNLQTLNKAIAQLSNKFTHRVRPTTPFRPIVNRHALTFGLVGTVTVGDDLTPRVEAHIPTLYQLEAVDAWVNSKVAVTGNSTYDVEVTTNSGTSWASIFSTLPTLSSGHTELDPAHTAFASHPMVVERGSTFRVNCDAAGGAEDVEVVVRWNLIRKPPTLDRRDDLE